jgi:hypothetical protein
MQKGNQRQSELEQAGGQRAEQDGRPAPGKVTRTSRLPGGSRQPVQRQASAAGAGNGASRARSLWDLTMDPWMDAAHRGTPLPDEPAAASAQAQPVQMQEVSEATPATESAPAPATDVAPAATEAQATPATGEPHGLSNNYGNWMIYPDDFAGSLPASSAAEFHVRQSEFEHVLEELELFHAQCYSLPNFHPSTGPGVFDVGFSPIPGAPGQLSISVRVAFNFVAALNPADYPGASATDLDWQAGEREQFTADCIAAINSTWSGAMQFKSTKTYWDNVLADVTVSVYESADEPHYTITVQKIPPGEWAGSDASAAGTGSNHGTANFDSEDLTPAAKAGGDQRAAVHEFGHMIGLGDEYGGKATPRHAASFQSVTGTGITTADDDRIMSHGERILAEHYITFLEGLKAVTAMEEWNYA